MTENGWPQCGSNQLDRSPIPGTDLVIPLQQGQPSKVVKAFCADYHLFVESLFNSRGATDEGGWTPTNSVATSNHLSGSAVDLNWNDHPFKVKGTFSSSQMETIRELLAWYDGMIFWGGDWKSPIDEMHWQMGYNTYQNPKTQQFIDSKIRGDGFSFFRKVEETPPIERKPVVPGEGGESWADVSQYQGIPLDDDYPYSIFSFRTNSGDKIDTLAIQNAVKAKELLDQDNQFSLVLPYYFFRPGEGNCDLHREILEDAGLWAHGNTVTMVDVESDRGTITGDHSWEINDEINRLRGWYGNTRRVVGYWNSNSDPGLWLTRPYALELIIPQYNNEPGNISAIRDEVVEREAFAHQYTDSAKDVPPWSGKGIDMNWTPYTLSELLILFGLSEEIKEPEPGSPVLDIDDAELEILCGAIGSQFLA